MTCGPPAARAASSTLTVPVAFASWLAIGSLRDFGTDGRAAKCTTESQPSIALARVSGSSMEPSTNSASRPSKPLGSPVERSSITETELIPLLSRSRRQTFAPMKPAPPVTRTLKSTVRKSPDSLLDFRVFPLGHPYRRACDNNREPDGSSWRCPSSQHRSVGLA